MDCPSGLVAQHALRPFIGPFTWSSKGKILIFPLSAAAHVISARPTKKWRAVGPRREDRTQFGNCRGLYRCCP